MTDTTYNSTLTAEPTTEAAVVVECALYASIGCTEITIEKAHSASRQMAKFVIGSLDEAGYAIVPKGDGVLE